MRLLARKHRLFLQWTLINSLSAVFFTVLYVHDFFANLSGAALYTSILILLFTVVMSIYAGVLCWRLDKRVESDLVDAKFVSRFNNDLNHVFHAIWVCQILGIIGALVGYREQTLVAAKETGNANAAIQEVFVALGNGLIATMLGVICSLLFFIEYRLLESHLSKIDHD